ncbi:hypothetical protein PTTG_27615, partial [Puccinia triticina 1-1 BBBD Race 1]
MLATYVMTFVICLFQLDVGAAASSFTASPAQAIQQKRDTVAIAVLSFNGNEEEGAPGDSSMEKTRELVLSNTPSEHRRSRRDAKTAKGKNATTPFPAPQSKRDLPPQLAALFAPQNQNTTKAPLNKRDLPPQLAALF